MLIEYQRHHTVSFERNRLPSGDLWFATKSRKTQFKPKSTDVSVKLSFIYDGLKILTQHVVMKMLYRCRHNPNFKGTGNNVSS